MNTENAKSQSAARTAEIRLLGQRIQLRATNPDPEITDEAIRLVTERIDAAEKRGAKSNLSPNQIMLLALLDLAEEYVQAKRRTAQYQAEIRSRADELKGALDEADPTP